MKGKKAHIAGLAAILCALAAAAARADQYDDSGLYLGGSYGLATLDGRNFDDENDFLGLFAGWQILPVLGVEAGYSDFGTYGNQFGTADVEAYTVTVNGRLPLSQSVAVFARIGPMWSETDVVIGSFAGSVDSEEILLGAGVSFQIASNLDLRLTYDWIDQDLDASDIEGVASGNFDADLNLLSVGLKLEF